MYSLERKWDCDTSYPAITRLECLRTYVPTNYELPTHAYKLLN